MKYYLNREIFHELAVRLVPSPNTTRPPKLCTDRTQFERKDNNEI